MSPEESAVNSRANGVNMLSGTYILRFEQKVMIFFQARGTI